MGVFDEFRNKAMERPETLEEAAAAVTPEPGAVQKFLNIVDYPAAVVRAKLADREGPESVTSGADRVTGREILTKLFNAPENKQTGWGISQYIENPEELPLDVAGLAVEIFTDPLTYVGIGGLTKAGRAAKVEGALPKGFFKQMSEVAPTGERYRNLLSVANPMRGPFSPADIPVAGLSPEAAKAAQSIADTATNAFMKAPGVQGVKDYAEQLWRRGGGVGSSTLRKIFKEGRFDQIARDRENARPIFDLEQKLAETFKDVPHDEAMSKLRAAIETPKMFQGQIEPAVENLRRDFIEFSGHMADDLKDAGIIDYNWLDISPLFDPKTVASMVKTGKLNDDAIDVLAGYVARGQSNVASDVRMGRAIIHEGRNRKSFEHVRTEALGHGWNEGAELINEFATDPQLHAALGNKDEFARIAQQKYGDRVVKYIQQRDDAGRLLFRDLLTGEIVEKYDSEILEAISKMAKDNPQELLSGAMKGLRPQFARDKGVKFVASNQAAFERAVKNNPDLSDKISVKVADMGDDAMDIMMGRKKLRKDGIDYTAVHDAADEETLFIKTKNKDGNDVLLAPVVHTNTDRFREMHRIMSNPKNADVLTDGVFPNDLMTEMHSYAQGHAHRVGMVNSAYRAIGNAIAMGGTTEGASTLESVLKNTFQGSVNRLRARKKIYGHMREAMGDPITDEALEKLTTKEMEDLLPFDTLIDPDLARDLNNGTVGAASNPRGIITQALADYGNLWKASVLTWPARYVRDWTSATMRLIEGGLITRPEQARDYAQRAHRIFMGAGDERLLKNQAIRDQLAKAGVDPDTATPEQASRAFKYLFAKERGGAMSIRQDIAQGEVVGLRGVQRAVPGMEESTGSALGDIGNYVSEVMKGDSGRRARRIENEFKNRRFITALRSPSDLQGVAGGDAVGNALSNLAGNTFRFGDAVGDYTDTTTRMMGFLAELENGVDPKIAMDRVQSALVNYDPRLLNPMERKYIKAWVPFYTFWRGNLPWVANQLMHRPGGPVRQMLRVTQSNETEADPTVPDWMRETVAVPLTTKGSDTKMYLTSFGLMTEDALSTLAGATELFTNTGQGMRSLVNEGLGRVHPIPKSLLEWGLGASTFRTTIEGGEPLSDMDPSIGRLYSNIAERVTGEKVSPRGLFPGQDVAEHFAQVLPAVSRILGAAKTITDTRDISFARRALNLGSGLKVTTMSPEQQLSELERRINEYKAQYSPATYNFEQVFVNQEQLQNLSPEAQQELLRLDSVSRSIPVLKREAKKRRESMVKEKQGSESMVNQLLRSLRG